MADDRITDILKGHIELAEKQLDLLRRGIRLNKFEADALGLYTTEDELTTHITNLENSLARHNDLNP